MYILYMCVHTVSFCTYCTCSILCRYIIIIHYLAAAADNNNRAPAAAKHVVVRRRRRPSPLLLPPTRATGRTFIKKKKNVPKYITYIINLTL